MMKRLNNKKIIMFYLLLQIVNSGCTRFVEVDPPVTAITGSTVFNDDATATGTLTGIYSNLANNNSLADGIGSVSIIGGLSSDELMMIDGDDPKLKRTYLNALLPSDDLIWARSYKFLHSVNSAIEGLKNSSKLTDQVKEQLEGEAIFLRAFFNFYLVNAFGDVPLVTSSDYRTNASMGRTPKAQVYDQIVADLKKAKSLLKSGYVESNGITQSSERVRPNKWTACALLARVYLYIGDWANAELEATSIIKTGIYSLPSLNEVFLKTSSETIWALMPVDLGWNTWNARLFILSSAGPSNSVYPAQLFWLNSEMIESFEAQDKRKAEWTNSVNVISNSGVGPIIEKRYYYPAKYKAIKAPANEYTVVFRLAEMYLIRAEARIQKDNIAEGISDLSVIRKRALSLSDNWDLSDLNLTKNEALLKVEHERRVELFTEWGHRWFDLKRTNRINQIMPKVSELKGGVWKNTAQLYPVPEQDIILNPKLKPQNQGY